MFRYNLNCLRRCSNQATNSFSVTTPIFYVNAAPHIGHLYSAVIADTLCRYQRLRFPTCNVRLTTGTDEHGSKIQQAANDHVVNVTQYCETISGRYASVFREANIEHTDFVRTTEERHRKAVTEFWKCLQRNGHIYSAAYSGWYCVSDETFLTESQVSLDPETEVHHSMESGHPVEWTEELNYMFRLSSMQNDLINWVKHNDRIRPKKFQKILLDMLNEKLPDVSISRPVGRVHWGIPVPDDSTQTVYVWLDALVNYLTTCGYPNYTFLDNWPPSVQVLGKDILKFHGVYWPAFLMAADLEPPRELLVHSHWTVDGQKMSKSKHNVVDPVEASKTYTMEGLRYFLLREGVAHSDGNFSRIKAVRILNSELADTLGNLLSRVCALSLNPRQIYPALEESRVEELLNEDSSRRLLANLQQMTERCGEHYNERNLHLVVDSVIATLHAANAFFESMKPWELRSRSSIISTINLNNAKKLETILGMTMDALRVCAIILQPIVPQLSGRLLDKLSVTSDKRLWGNLTDTFATASLKTRHMPERPLNSGDPVLFRRIILKDPLIEEEAMPAKKQAEVQMSNRQAKKAARKAKNQ